jgi:tetratricopeptide (TPR) repeat protein
MKRWMWLSLAAVVVAAAAVTLVALPKAPDWTSTSPEAVAEFQAGMDAAMKVYYEDARRHYQRAVELDPDFVVANLMAIDMYRDDEEKVAAMWSKVENADLAKLTPRERFYVQRAKARHAKQPEEAQRLLDEYVAKYPNDPYILNQKAMETWSRNDLEEAERLYQRLVEIAPNWVIAYNQLGYINMMKGRFAEAEEYFKSYRFIAPDQANPHDSLGELFITQGRYDEARESLETAIRIKPDFWAAYQHLELMQTLNDDLDGAQGTIERVRAAGGPEDLVTSMECLERYTRLRKAGAWQEIMDGADSECVRDFHEGYSTVTTHFAACKLGDWEKAMELEVETANLIDKVEEHGNEKDLMTLRGAFLHMQGVRLALQGDYAGAEEKLRAADEGLTYFEAGVGMYKLFNRMILAEVLLADNQDAEAHGLLATIRSINPVMVAEFEDAGLKNLGLDRM